MKISPETLTVIKNFSTINNGIEFRKGHKLSTISSGKSILAVANLKDEFPQDFCVYDLNQFMSVYSLYDSAELDFDESNIIFKNGDGRNKTKYRKTSREMIVTPPDRELNIPSVDVSFTLSEEDYAKLMKAANVLSTPHISIQSDGEKIVLQSFDAQDDSKSTNTIEIGEGDGKQYRVVFKTENIKMIPGSYDVQISFKGISHFKNTKIDIQYWIASESKETTYGV
jgi:hypothetical protein